MENTLKRKKGKKKKKNPGTPAHAMATAANDELCAEPDTEKATGNPVDNVFSPRGTYAENRTSEPIIAGHAAYSTGDHGVGQGRAAELAVGHPLADSPVPGAYGVQHLDLQTTSRSPLAELRSSRAGPGDMFRQQARARVSTMDQATAAGYPRGLGSNQPSNDPRRTPNAPDSGGDFTGTNDIPTEHHINMPGRARATASPESHSRYGVTRPPTQAMKRDGRSNFEIMRDHMYPGSANN